MSEQLAITMGPVDARGRRKVVAILGDRQHPHTFDPFDQFQRRQFREAVIFNFKLSDDAHEHLESEILAAADSADSLWTPQTISLADVEAKPLRWFWPFYFPEGAYTVLDGDPNEGKSTIAIDIAARYTRGDSMPPHNAPDDTCESGNVLLLSAEDDLERTIKPRLVAAGARVERVHFLRTVAIDGEDERFIALPGDTPIIENVVNEKRIGFIVIDVLSAFTEPGVSTNDEAAMRRLAGPLADMLERTRAMALVLRHLNKKENLRSIYRGGGSIAIVAAARAAFAIAPNPEAPNEKVFAAIKHNLGPRPHSLTYTIEPAGDSSRIAWGGQTDLTAADVLKGQPEGGSNKTGKAKAIIADILGRGPRGENEVKAACEQAGLSISTYWRARRALGVESERAGFGSSGQWLLSLPSANGQPQHEF